jgi:hypothetical protein
MYLWKQGNPEGIYNNCTFLRKEVVMFVPQMLQVYRKPLDKEKCNKRMEQNGKGGTMQTIAVSGLGLKPEAKLILIFAETYVDEMILPTVADMKKWVNVTTDDLNEAIQRLQRDSHVWLVDDKYLIPTDIEDDKLEKLLSQHKVDTGVLDARTFCKSHDKRVKIQLKVADVTETKEVMRKWNEMAEQLTKVHKINFMTSERIKILSEGWFDIDKAVHEIQHSKFLQGNTGWTVYFDWVLKKKNYAKVVEGNYRDNRFMKQSNVRDISDVPEY